MNNVVGIFTSADAARQACDRLRTQGIPADHINLMMPGEHPIDDIPHTDAEQPAVATAIGSVVGGVAGGATSFAVASIFLIPGVAPVAAVGAGAVALLSALGAIGGAAAGAATGAALDHSLQTGLPTDELYVYEDALRQNRSIVIVETDDRFDPAAIRNELEAAGAESIDAARDQWWVGLRSAEEEEYRAKGHDFDADESLFRHGFEAAQIREVGDHSYDEVAAELRERYPDEYSADAFRRGFERGLRHRKGRSETLII